MTCEKTTEQLIDWLEGELPSEIAEEVAEHVNRCPDCAREVNQIRQALAAVTHPAEDPGEAYFDLFYARVQRHIADEAVQTPWYKRWWERLTTPAMLYRVAAATATLLVVLVGTMSYTGRLRSNDAQPSMAKLHGNYAVIAKKGRLVAATRVDPDMRQAVDSLEGDEIDKLQVEMAKVLLGQLSHSKVMVLPGSLTEHPVVNSPLVVDLSEEELTAVTDTVSKDINKWTL